MSQLFASGGQSIGGSVLVVRAYIDLDYGDIEWFALEMNRDHSVVFEIAPKYCISDNDFGL